MVVGRSLARIVRVYRWIVVENRVHVVFRLWLNVVPSGRVIAIDNHGIVRWNKGIFAWRWFYFKKTDPILIVVRRPLNMVTIR